MLVGIAIIVLVVWVIFGFLLMIMAGLTYNFHERHFSPLWMLLLGPLGWYVWLWAEKREAKKRIEN